MISHLIQHVSISVSDWKQTIKHFITADLLCYISAFINNWTSKSVATDVNYCTYLYEQISLVYQFSSPAKTAVVSNWQLCTIFPVHIYPN